MDVPEKIRSLADARALIAALEDEADDGGPPVNERCSDAAVGRLLRSDPAYVHLVRYCGHTEAAQIARYRERLARDEGSRDDEEYERRSALRHGRLAERHYQALPDLYQV